MNGRYCTLFHFIKKLFSQKSEHIKTVPNNPQQFHVSELGEL